MILFHSYYRRIAGGIGADRQEIQGLAYDVGDGEVMLSAAKLVGFIPISGAERALSFYVDMLKLQFVQDDKFAIVVRSGANLIRLVRMKSVEPAPFTILGWEVADIRSEVAGLAAAGVVFARYSFLEQDEAGIWTAPGGAMVAWFPDPDGNLLSLSQHE